MDYAQFKDFLADFLWKPGDTSLLSSLDSLIIMGTSELSRKLDITRREQTVTLNITTPDVNLPADFKQVLSLNTVYNNQYLPLSQAPLSSVIGYRNLSAPSLQRFPNYAITTVDGVKQLALPLLPATPVGPVLATLILVYRVELPNFQVEDESWLCDEYLDLYTYTVLSHTAPYLREDERVQLWAAMKTDALMSVLDEDKRKIAFGGSPLKMRPHHQAP